METYAWSLEVPCHGIQMRLEEGKGIKILSICQGNILTNLLLYDAIMQATLSEIWMRFSRSEIIRLRTNKVNLLGVTLSWPTLSHAYYMNRESTFWQTCRLYLSFWYTFPTLSSFLRWPMVVLRGSKLNKTPNSTRYEIKLISYSLKLNMFELYSGWYDWSI